MDKFLLTGTDKRRTLGDVEKQVQFRIPDEWWPELKAAADDDGRTVSSWIRRHVRQALDRQKTDR